MRRGELFELFVQKHRFRGEIHIPAHIGEIKRNKLKKVRLNNILPGAAGILIVYHVEIVIGLTCSYKPLDNGIQLEFQPL